MNAVRKALIAAFAMVVRWLKFMLSLWTSAFRILIRKARSQAVPIIVFLFAAGIFLIFGHHIADKVLKYNAYLLNNDTIHRFSAWLAHDERSVLPVTFIEIDNSTYKEWGRPVVTPRKYLRELIQKAVTGRARVIVVDIDLSVDSGEPDDDAELARYFEEYRETIPIILAKRVDQTEKGYEHAHSYLDPIVENHQKIYWSLVKFFKDPDGIIRHFHQIYTYHDSNSTVCHIDSIPLLINSLIEEDRRVENSQMRKYPCTAPANGIGKLLREPLDIYYRFTGRSDIPTEKFQQDVPGVILLIVESAMDVLRHTMGGAFFYDRVVIIGGSYTEGRDLYATPLGLMPGAMIIANTITTSYLLSGQQHGKSWGSMTLTLIMSVMLLILSNFLRVLLIIIMFFAFVLIIPISVRLIEYPQILNVIADAIIIFAVIQSTQALADLIWDVHQLGWRAFLKK